MKHSISRRKMLYSIGATAISMPLLSANDQSVTPSALPKPSITKKPLAAKPPLGWNNYNGYRGHTDEIEILRNLEIFAKKLAPHGYEYFVVDYGWYNEVASVPGSLPGSIRPANNDPIDFALDKHGYPIGSRTFYPNGLKRIADRAHELGVKFGVHMMRGMLRKAWEFNLPVKGTNVRMRDIADTKNICTWCKDTYGVDMTKPGAQEYYDGLIEHLAGMGVDFVKYDDIVPYPAEMAAIGQAIAKCKRDILLSLSPGDATTPTHKEHYQWGHMLRITGDVWDTRGSLDNCFRRWRDWQGTAEPGFWPDMDMLCLGTMTAMLDPARHKTFSKVKAEQICGHELEEVFFRPCRFSPAQERTFLTMRALSASPLFMGGCLIRSEQRVFDLITHPDILACNQNGNCGMLQSERDKVEIWRTTKRNMTGQGWIGIFNRNQSAVAAYIPTLENLGLLTGKYKFRNIWAPKEFIPGEAIKIDGDDVVFLEYSLL
jgi:alpha-galactosidase